MLHSLKQATITSSYSSLTICPTDSSSGAVNGTDLTECLQAAALTGKWHHPRIAWRHLTWESSAGAPFVVCSLLLFSPKCVVLVPPPPSCASSLSYSATECSSRPEVVLRIKWTTSSKESLPQGLLVANPLFLLCSPEEHRHDGTQVPLCASPELLFCKMGPPVGHNHRVSASNCCLQEAHHLCPGET